MSLRGILGFCQRSLLFIISLLLLGCSQPTDESPTPHNSPEPVIHFTSTPEAIQFGAEEGSIFLSIEENGYAHLFVVQPQGLPLTRITSGEWNDIAPALSPDHSMLAFASDQDWPVWLGIVACFVVVIALTLAMGATEAYHVVDAAIASAPSTFTLYDRAGLYNPGRVDVEDILDVIFREFCVGK